MKILTHSFIIFFILINFLSCNQSNEKKMKSYEKGTFGYDLSYLSKKDSLIVLTANNDNSQIIVSAKYQGKVFTSTADGPDGKSLGFVNYKALDSETIDEHMNGYGGENRLWLGPEGGKYSVYFEKGKKQIYENWHTPKPIDTEPWSIVNANQKKVTLTKEMAVTNYQGYNLQLNIERNIQIIESENAYSMLGINKNENIKLVAYTTDNKITNTGSFEWTQKTGTICIWMLDMFIPAPKAISIIPFNKGTEGEMGKVATTDYFGEIPEDRLKSKDSILYLRTDGKFRSKLGMNGKRTKAIAGNYDPDSQRLTIITYDVDKDAIYLNQEWNPEKDPLSGDAMNAYNDGPLEDGSIMGPFLELESVSPAAFLKPSESMTHKHTVYHFIGNKQDLNYITKKLFGVLIDEIENVL